jgi:hypothetical protein
MTVKEFIEQFNVIDRNVYIYPKTKKDLTNSNGDKSKYILAIHKFDNPNYLEKSVKKYSKKLSRVDISRLSTITKPNYVLKDILNAEVWRVSTDCSWYDRVPPICLYIKDIELITKRQARKKKKEALASLSKRATEEHDLEESVSKTIEEKDKPKTERHKVEKDKPKVEKDKPKTERHKVEKDKPKTENKHKVTEKR